MPVARYRHVAARVVAGLAVGRPAQEQRPLTFPVAHVGLRVLGAATREIGGAGLEGDEPAVERGLSVKSRAVRRLAGVVAAADQDQRAGLGVAKELLRVWGRRPPAG